MGGDGIFWIYWKFLQLLPVTEAEFADAYIMFAKMA